MSQPIAVSETDAALERLAAAIAGRCAKGTYYLIGIADGGIHLTQLLAERLPGNPRWGVLNALFHRDDVGLKAVFNDFQPSSIDFVVEDARIVLVDDVFATGRTVRAALNELFDHGRPSEVLLATLVDTGQRRLPLHPDFVGMRLHPSDAEKVVVSETEDPAHPLAIALQPK